MDDFHDLEVGLILLKSGAVATRDFGQVLTGTLLLGVLAVVLYGFVRYRPFGRTQIAEGSQHGMARAVPLSRTEYLGPVWLSSGVRHYEPHSDIRAAGLITIGALLAYWCRKELILAWGSRRWPRTTGHISGSVVQEGVCQDLA